MDTTHIRMSHRYGETPSNIFSDFDWIRRHEKELLAQYGECSLIVYQAQVLGVGATYEAALMNAEQNLPPDSPIITPVHRRIFYRHPFFRIRPSEDKEG
jgi:hypothetical protein